MNPHRKVWYFLFLLGAMTLLSSYACAASPDLQAQIDEAIKSDRMKPSEAMRHLDDYERGLKEYTYLNF